ncbi:MAG: MFS transporter [Phycisphaeraceae bacterium]|nr:MAG: MFS transporter [Phycisphaeraceae bacterium]
MSQPQDPGTPTGRDASFLPPTMTALGTDPSAPVRLKHPSGLRVLFLTEMWERFSYYGMKALLTLFLVTVIAVGSLKDGSYTNVLEIAEERAEPGTAGVDGKPAPGPKFDVVQSRVYHVVVGSGSAPADAPAPAPAPVVRTPGKGGGPEASTPAVGDAAPALVLRRAHRVQDPARPNDPKALIWAPIEGGSPDSTTLTPDAATPGTFNNQESAWIVSNPTDKPIRIKAQFRRDGKDAQTYFTVNDSPTLVTGEVKPDSELKPGERPFVLRVQTNRGQSGMNWTKERAGSLMAWYTGLVYLTPIIGGVLADRFLGTHRCLLIGGAVIAAGHFVLMGENETTLYLGLALVIIGTGFFKSNVSTMVGQLYKDGDGRRDAGFTIFYMGINLGAFIGPLICGWLRVNHSWSLAFGAAGFGMVLGLIQYVIGRPKHLAGIGLPPSAHASVGQKLLEDKPLTREDKQRIGVIFIMAFFVIFFWAAFEQAAGSMVYFGNERTDRTLPSWLSFLVAEPAPGEPPMWPAEWLNSVNPLMILVLAPIFASVWVRLATRGKEPSTPAKFAIGLITLGIGFLFMVFGSFAGEGGVKVSPVWIMGAFFLHTCAELCLSPVGLSMVTKLAPVKLASMLMGVWFVSNFFANFIAAKLTGAVDKIAETGFLGIPGYAGFFSIFVIAPCAAGFVLIFLVPTLKRMMHGKG